MQHSCTMIRVFLISMLSIQDKMDLCWKWTGLSITTIVMAPADQLFQRHVESEPDLKGLPCVVQALQTLQQGQAAIRNIKWMFSELDLDVDYSTYTAAQGAILAMASTTTINDFKTFFTNLNINSPPAENPWLQDWYMNRYQCKLPGANYATYRWEIVLCMHSVCLHVCIMCRIILISNLFVCVQSTGGLYQGEREFW